MKEHERTLINAATNFKGVYLSGFYIQNPATVTALSFLFDKVYLPNQLELVIEFAKTHTIELDGKFNEFEMLIKGEESGDEDNPLEGLTDEQILTAKRYLYISQNFCINHHELFPEIFITDMIKDNEIFDVKLIKEKVKGNLNRYQVKINPMTVSLGGTEVIKEKLNNNFVPIIGGENLLKNSFNKLNDNKAIASILAMKSIEMLLPSFKSAKPQEILEARDKLSDHLPSFWAAMLKLSIDSKKIIIDCKDTRQAVFECQNIVDTIVRPSLVEIILKMEKERKNWFYRILSPVANTARLFIGSPVLNQTELIKNAFALATNSTNDFIQTSQKIEDLKAGSGLTYLLEMGKVLK